jgi:hypothetical protein
MEIPKLPEFVAYCQDNAADADLPAHIDFADKWADFAIRLRGQYGGHGEQMPEWIELAHKRMVEDGVVPTQEQLFKSHEVLSRFWEHGEAFDEWFQSKVIVVQES